MVGQSIQTAGAEFAWQDPSFQLWELPWTVAVAQEIEIGAVPVPSNALTSPPIIVLTSTFELQLVLVLIEISSRSELTGMS